MSRETAKPHYPHLPHLTPEEFEVLVQVARSHGKSGSIISDNSVAMARAVLLDGQTYLKAAQSIGKTARTASQQAVAILLRYHTKSAAPIQPHELFR